jgi:signal transduction histidine kinase
MGLTICKAIVDAHRGQLDLTPRPEGGTRATITLPRLPSVWAAIQ